MVKPFVLFFTPKPTKNYCDNVLYKVEYTLAQLQNNLRVFLCATFSSVG